MPLEQVPLVQKRAIRLYHEAGKPVIVATQMLDSMISDRRPTRAEVSDVANAVLDGADAVMLSAETSVGAHPAHTVDTMARIVSEAEAVTSPATALESDVAQDSSAGVDAGAAIAAAACAVGMQVGAVALCCFTSTGATARRLARQRPTLPLFAFTQDELVRSQLALSWGIESHILAPAATVETMSVELSRILLSAGACRDGDRVVVVFGSRSGVPGATDSMRVLRIHGADSDTTRQPARSVVAAR
jgi:pyruvate kinase